MALSFAFLIVLSGVASGYHSVLEEGPGYENCTTVPCQKLAQTLMEFMDTSVDPCKDFFHYACGGWIKRNPIPDDRTSYITYEALKDTVSERIASSLRILDDESHSRATHDAASLYKGCVNKDAREAHGLDLLLNVLRRYGGWPIVDSEWNRTDYVWYKRLPEIMRDLSYTPVIGIGIDVDGNQTTQHAIYIVSSRFGLGRDQLVDLAHGLNEKIAAAYRDYIISVAKLLNPGVGETELERDVSDIIAFESKLAEFATPAGATRGAKSWYHKMTVDEVQRQTENKLFRWTDFLNDVFKDFPEITDETEVVLTEADYMRKTIKLTSNTNPRILANYIGWVVASNLGPQTTEEFRNIELRFDRIRTGIQKLPKLDRTCADVVIRLMGYAVGRLYVDNYLGEVMKTEVDEILEDVRSAYRLTIEQNRWMDDRTKSQALRKLNAIIKMIGYPRWILDNNELNKYYESAKGLNSDHFLLSYLKAMKSRVDYVLGKWNKPSRRGHDWLATPAIVNAFYDPPGNTIVFPAAILGEPYYEHGRLTGFNFGALGGVIGHELTHAFDDQGSEFGPNGNLINWWTEETSAKFDEKANCFRKQYSSYVEPTTNLPLNGNNSIGENIADNGGLTNSFVAYKMHNTLASVGSEQTYYRIAGHSFTPEQLFFIGRATVSCGSERKESLANKIQYEPHTPSQFRVNVPLSNSKEFAETFNCPLGSPMNPRHKCLLW